MTEQHGSNRFRDFRLWSLLSLALGVPSLSACLVAVREPPGDGGESSPGNEVYVDEAPPPPRSDLIVGVAPSRSHVWVENYWSRHDEGWSWGGGHWEARPYQGSVRVNGHWEQRPRGFVWVGGYWQ
jgi:hypothetical protein